MQSARLIISTLAIILTFGITLPQAIAKTVHVTLTVKEVTTIIDNQGTKQASWTFDGTIPGPVVRAKVGDTIDFTLINSGKNSYPHSIDFHNAIVDVLGEFAPIAPGESKHFTYKAQHQGVFMYHCGAPPMIQHIARGMYGIVIIDPKRFTRDFPKPDREYVLVQSAYFPDPDNVDAMFDNKWVKVLINGKAFKYDPVHDPDAKLVLESKPGELVRIHFVNAMVNDPIALHPIAGIWERVYPSGNAKNVMYGIQTYNLAVAEASSFDIVSPKTHATNNAIVDHTMRAALRGSITVLMNKPDANPKMGRGENILPR
ncbi:MAG: multicopper oxidase domain-containing protein [Mariprofundaceae bacterium]